MKPIESFVLLLWAVVGVVLIGQRMKVPYPIALVLGGLYISLVPGLPRVRINPDLVFLLMHRLEREIDIEETKINFG